MVDWWEEVTNKWQTARRLKSWQQYNNVIYNLRKSKQLRRLAWLAITLNNNKGGHKNNSLVFAFLPKGPVCRLRMVLSTSWWPYRCPDSHYKGISHDGLLCEHPESIATPTQNKPETELIADKIRFWARPDSQSECSDVEFDVYIDCIDFSRQTPDTVTIVEQFYGPLYYLQPFILRKISNHVSIKVFSVALGLSIRTNPHSWLQDNLSCETSNSSSSRHINRSQCWFEIK